MCRQCMNGRADKKVDISLFKLLIDTLIQTPSSNLIPGANRTTSCTTWGIKMAVT